VKRVLPRALGPALAVGLALTGCPREPTGYAEPPNDGAEIIDAVDGKACVKTPATSSAIRDDKTYYFCSPESAASFRERL